MKELLPPQVYRPGDFVRELACIHGTCKEIPGGSWRGKRWQDIDGNVFAVDCVDQLISVNR